MIANSVQSPTHHMYVLCYFTHRCLNSAWYHEAHSLIEMSYLAKIASNEMIAFWIYHLLIMKYADIIWVPFRKTKAVPEAIMVFLLLHVNRFHGCLNIQGKDVLEFVLNLILLPPCLYCIHALAEISKCYICCRKNIVKSNSWAVYLYLQG